MPLVACEHRSAARTGGAGFFNRLLGFLATSTAFKLYDGRALRGSPSVRNLTVALLGRSVKGRKIEAHVFSGPKDRTVVVLGAFHGDEPKSVVLARRLIELLEENSEAGDNAKWIIVPVVNPDGYARRKRRNANGVDINRNFPTANWVRGMRRSRMFGGSAPASEPETRAVIAAVELFRPARIITIHSIGQNRHCNNYDGPAGDMAEAMSSVNGYPVTSSIGYATPGSFGTWAGMERGIPSVTLELPSTRSAKRCWEDNRAALLGCL